MPDVRKILKTKQSSAVVEKVFFKGNLLKKNALLIRTFSRLSLFDFKRKILICFRCCGKVKLTEEFDAYLEELLFQDLTVRVTI